MQSIFLRTLKRGFELKGAIRWLAPLLLLALHAGTMSVSAFTRVSFQRDSLTIQGQVADGSGSPLSGATVSLKGSNVTVFTNNSGNYAIQVPTTNGTLVFTYVGYAPKEETIGGRQIINVALGETNANLDEVVVVGYATREKSAVTGAISQINNKAFESRPLVNTASVLQGAVSGLTVMRGSGQPGRQGYDFQIRGFSSVNGNRPLVLIDGVNGDINTLNPSDIASVTVLKDAAASIYGARAADGVILVTTKQGQSGVPQVTYNTNLGIKTPDYLKKVTTTLQLAEMNHEGLTNIGQAGVPDEVFERIRRQADPDPTTGWVTYLQGYPGFYRDNNWNDIIYGDALQQNHNVSVSGGTENSAYLFSGGYTRDNGVFNYGENHADRYNVRMNYDFKLLDRINIQTRNSYSNDVIVEPSQLFFIMSNIPRMFDYVPLRTPSGQYYTYQGYINPAQELEEGGTRRTNSNAFSFNVKADVELLKGLKLTGQAGVTNTNYNDEATTRTFTLYNWAGEVQGSRNPTNGADYYNIRNLYNLYNGYLEYSRTIASDHNLSVMAGTSFESFRDLGTSISASNFLGNEIFTPNLADQSRAEYTSINGHDTDWALLSYFGRLSYGFKGKLFVDATLRMDGSSKFSPEKRWSAVFPAVSAAYNFSQDDFIQSLNVVDNLKLRASWGRAGNQEISNFGNYGYIPLVTIDGSNAGVYPFGMPNARYPSAFSGIASESRTWETLETLNIGLDFGFLGNRLTGSIDIYDKQNRNMLVNVQVPVTLGGTAPTQNLGHLTTKGFDLTLGWRDQVGKFSYNIIGMLNDNRNELVELRGNNVISQGLNRTPQGYSMLSYFGYEAAGIIQNEAQLNEYKKLQGLPATIGIGDIMYKDLDGDGILSPNGDPARGTTGDLVHLGTLLPRYTFSSTVNLAYSNFDLSVVMQGVGKQNNIREGSFAVPLSAIYYQPLEYFYGKTWTPENTNAPYPRLVPGGVGFDNLRDYNWQHSTMRVNSLAYLRFKVITLGYNFPDALCRRIGVNGIRLYVSGEDLFTVAKGTWDNSFDPEEGYQQSDEQTYPFTKVSSFGLQLKF